MKYTYFLLLICVFWSCGKQEMIKDVTAENLSEYITNNPDNRLVRDSLIACALGGEVNFLTNTSFPISILFYPEGNASDFKYFETETIDVNPNDLENYQRKELADSPIFNGYLRRFEREALDRNTWGIVTFKKDGNLHISNPIRLKLNDKPTEYNPSLLSIDQSEKLSPNFIWEDGIIPENVIYFHALLDANGELISGTYTIDRQFQFYNLSNVVLNIRDINPPPSLTPGESYTMVVMGVSVDNWVNLLLEKSFIASE